MKNKNLTKSDLVAGIKRDLASQSDIESLQLRAAAAEAETFISSEIQAGRLSSAEKSSLLAQYLQAVLDDLHRPLGEGTRVDALKTNQQSRLSNFFTTEGVDVDSEMYVLTCSGGGDTRVSSDRERELLEKTPLGRAVLNNESV